MGLFLILVQTHTVVVMNVEVIPFLLKDTLTPFMQEVQTVSISSLVLYTQRAAL